MQKPAEAAYQSPEELQEVLLQELESLFDRPCVQPPTDPKASFKLGLEKDYSNTFLITNPLAL